MILRAIKQTRQSVEKVRQHIEEKLPVSSTLQNKVNITCGALSGINALLVRGGGILNRLVKGGRHVHSSANFSWKYTATLQLLHEDYLFTYPPLSLVIYTP